MSIVSRTSIVLADRAEQIAREKSISFGEALRAARREMANRSDSATAGQGAPVWAPFPDAAAQRISIRTNAGSPLRGQAQSTTPDPAKVRDAVDMGLRLNTNLLDYAALLEVGSGLKNLGLGPQIISALQAELSAFINSALVGGERLPSVIIPAAADYMQQVYARALANKGNTQVWSEPEAMVVNGGVVPVAPGSAELAEMAERIAREKTVSFGEALRIARHDMAADVVDAQRLGQAITVALKTTFDTIFGGKQQKALDGMDVLKALEAASQALEPMNISGTLKIEMALRDSLSQSTQGVTSASDIDSIISNAVSAAQKAYAQALAG